MKRFVIFDLEATCYDNNRKDETKPLCFKNEIIEIGAVKLDESGNEIGRFAKFAKPKLFNKLSKFCTELTTIEQSHIDNADELRDVLVEFLDWCDGCTLISWGNYDKTQMLSDMERNDLMQSNYLAILDDHYSLKHLHGKWNNLKRGGVGMGRALKLEGLVLEGIHHRGIDDALNIAKIFKKYIERF